ncbi:MAG: hypothetical protein ABW072_05885 [Sedimenticola sp.]
MKALLSIILLATGGAAVAETEIEVSGRLGAELRLFPHSAAHAGQHGNSNLSLFAEPELYHEWNNGDDSLTFVPWFRLDQHDSERSHADIRELIWTHVSDDWELHAGIGKVFWGVTEFQHLVNVINQSDSVEDIDGEDKLGQPMINLSMVRDWGILDIFVLPGFRERTFPGQEGRLRTSPWVDTSQASFESAAGNTHTDIALRWSHTVGDYDIGLHWFHGTNRSPTLLVGTDGIGNTVLTPYYPQMDQLGLDLQATLDNWLWKLEAIWRDSGGSERWAVQGGFEYTFVGVMESTSDLGMLMEYGWDERGTAATSPMQNDLYFGARLAFNDEAGSELLAGFGYDFDYHTRVFQIEASRRFGDDWKASLDLRLISAGSSSDSYHNLRDDDHLQLTLERYF